MTGNALCMSYLAQRLQDAQLQWDPDPECVQVGHSCSRLTTGGTVRDDD